MVNLKIDTLILTRDDLKEECTLLLREDITLNSFICDNDLIKKKELIVYSDGSYSKTLTSRHF